MHWESRRQRVRDTACKLDSDHWNFSTQDQRNATALRVLLRRDADGADRVRALDSACPLDTGAVVVRDVGAMDPAASARLLGALGRAAPKHQADNAVAALALHDGAVATGELATMARGADTPAREPAVFWLGQTRGEDGARVLVELIDRNRDRDLREHTVFSLSQNHTKLAQDALRGYAGAPHDAHLRGKALFWLSQQGDADVERLIDALLREPGLGRGLRDEAVFALSQLPDGRATPALRAVLAGHHDRATRKQALFWLAQQDDEAAISVLDDMLEAPAKR